MLLCSWSSLLRVKDMLFGDWGFDIVVDFVGDVLNRFRSLLIVIV